jgi:2-polyprenyl-6-methoxyphenol hydroxylase-like FAD-dependent oxidoreductase
MASDFCDLRTGCNVQSLLESNNGVDVSYTAEDGSTKELRANWLIGADGKRGVVRKTFLEKMADIRQVHSKYRYEGTWVAANLHILLPTKETHPQFPPWELGMTPAEVYDLFWPKGWHFCSPPGKPVAAGRFGPYEQRLWRHEFCENDWNVETMDAEELLWENLTPMISRTTDATGRAFSEVAVFPRECIEVSTTNL